MDETGFRIGGKTPWQHIASTMLLTFYRTSAKRGSLLDDVTTPSSLTAWRCIRRARADQNQAPRSATATGWT
jgi:hypothetical protein